MANQAPAPGSPSPSPSPAPEAATILLIEDDPAQRAVVEASLTSRGYRVVTADNGRTAIELAGETEPDVVILDLGLPDLDGIDVCQHLRLWVRSPIIVLTADGSEERVVAALDAGADEYVSKPFSMPELLARVRVALRHRLTISASVGRSLLDVGDLRVDVAAHQAFAGGELIELQPKPFQVLTLMARNPGKVLTYSNLARQLWGPEQGAGELGPLRVAVSTVRARLGSGPHRPRIENVPHVGYRLVEPDNPA
jgi:two-component system KDP operon response regulator KdpE